MATTSHPYISGAGNLAQMIGHLRKNFPGTINSETVKKLGLAPNNESYVINALQFIGVIDEEGKKSDRGAEVFSHHTDGEFAGAFKKLLQTAYSDLHGLHGDGMWNLNRDELITYFRKTDKTSAAIGQRQAAVFQTFAALAGEVEAKGSNKIKGKVKTAHASTVKKKTPEKKAATGAVEVVEEVVGADGRREVALTVRIEINLPAGGTRDTYDAIFQSIRANLLNE